MNRLVLPLFAPTSFRRSVVCVAAVALVALLAACDKKDGGSTTTTSASTSTPAAAAAAAAGKKPKATLKLADAKSAYKAELEDLSKMKNPLDKKLDAFTAKIGKPTTDTGRKKTWYAVDGDKCTKLELDTKDGSLLEASTDKADCGM